MDVTSDEIRSSRFQGTRHVYDRREVDAFLHRAASTLEVYERKLTVTEAHVESLEKALDLAQSRARSAQNLESRIAELEAALAAAQHNYESAVQQTEASADKAAFAGTPRQADDVLAKARAEADRLKADAATLRRKAQESADAVLAAAEAEAAEILKSSVAARPVAAAPERPDPAEQDVAAALEALIQARQEELEELERSAIAAEDRTTTALTAATEAEAALSKAQARLVDAEELAAVAEARKLSHAEATQRVAFKAERQERLQAVDDEERTAAVQRAVAEAEERAEAAQQAFGEAEERAARLEKELVLARADLEARGDAADAERAAVMAETEQRVAEALAKAEADREEMLAMAAQEAAAHTAANGSSQEELASLRRQVGQMRTALSNIQQRFSSAAKLSPEEMELAAALVDLDLHDVDQLVDLTSSAPTRGEVGGEDDEVTKAEAGVIKSKWAQAGAVPAGTLRRGSADQDEARPSWRDQQKPPSWRDSVSPTKKPGAAKQAAEASEESLGFYERRLAGLRERIKDAGGED